MNDAKLYFSTIQAVTIKTDTVSEFYLDVKDIEEFGAGSQVYLNIAIATAFTYSKPDGSAYMDVYLCTNTGAPTSAHRIQTVKRLWGKSSFGTGHSSLLGAGLKVKQPLPNVGLLSCVGLVFQLKTAMTLGTFNCYLTID